VDPDYFRPTEVELLLGDPTKAKEKLGWQPEVKFDELVKIMMKADLEAAKYEKYKRQYNNGDKWIVIGDYRGAKLESGNKGKTNM